MNSRLRRREARHQRARRRSRPCDLSLSRLKRSRGRAVRPRQPTRRGSSARGDWKGAQHGHHGHPGREGLSRRKRNSRRRLLRRPDAAGEGQLPHHRHSDVARAELRQGVRLCEEGRGAGEPRPGCPGRQDRRCHRRRLRPADRRQDDRSVRHRLHPGRRGNVDQHERERGDRQPRPRTDGAQEGRVPVLQSERPRQLRAVDQRHLPDRLPAGADPAPRELHGGAARAAACLFREGEGIRSGAEDGPHAPAGRGADVARPGVSWLGHDDRRGGRADRRSAAVPARDQPRRHGDRNHGDRGAGVPRTRDEIPFRADRQQIHSRGRPRRGHIRHRRLCAAFGRTEADLGKAHQDLQRHPPARLRATVRLQRDQSAADAARAARSCRARSIRSFPKSSTRSASW